ncbi:MAG: hypothetical protein IPM82_05985 [Saprospiraceae bacterium]|nr:hypothetical protein [Saprospiraceae bacterium]
MYLFDKLFENQTFHFFQYAQGQIQKMVLLGATTNLVGNPNQTLTKSAICFKVKLYCAPNGLKQVGSAGVFIFETKGGLGRWKKLAPLLNI